MKILLFGKNGQLGWELQRSLAPLGELVALGRSDDDLCGDFTDPPGLAATVRAVMPDVIVNAAAYTAVDQAETEPAAARTINALAPAVLAAEAQKLNAWLVHYSTDYVFDGHGETPWRETDVAIPLSVYGRTKLEGEQAVAGHVRHLIFRAGWIYAAHGDNFAKTMLRLAQAHDRLTVVADQIGAPTGAELLADITAHALRMVHTRPQLAGLYHVAAGGETSRHGYACHVIETARRAGQPILTACGAILPVSSAACPRPAPRPLNSRLNTAKLRAAFGLYLPNWQAGVNRMLEEVLGAKAF